MLLLMRGTDLAVEYRCRYTNASHTSLQHFLFQSSRPADRGVFRLVLHIGRLHNYLLSISRTLARSLSLSLSLYRSFSCRCCCRCCSECFAAALLHKLRFYVRSNSTRHHCRSFAFTLLLQTNFFNRTNWLGVLRSVVLLVLFTLPFSPFFFLHLPLPTHFWCVCFPFTLPSQPHTHTYTHTRLFLHFFHHFHSLFTLSQAHKHVQKHALCAYSFVRRGLGLYFTLH